VLLLAKTPAALKALGGQFEKREVRKIYLAVAEGKLPLPKGELTHWLRKNALNRRSVVVEAGAPEARECRLLYRVLGERDGRSLVEIELLTGRYHQIRAQLAAVGCPVAGDVKYGASSRVGEEGESICLHAWRLAFRHPKTGEPVDMEAPAPDSTGWEGFGGLAPRG
jgi:23S rRNA pseudouridine1911/1915/1917 synthase